MAEGHICIRVTPHSQYRDGNCLMVERIKEDFKTIQCMDIICWINIFGTLIVGIDVYSYAVFSNECMYSSSSHDQVVSICLFAWFIYTLRLAV